MMSDDAFARLVAEEVKNNNRVSAEQAQYLRLPENQDRWQRALEALIRNLQGQLDVLDREQAVRTERYRALGDDGVRLLAEAEAEIEDKRKRIARFKFHVESRYDEVVRMVALGDDADDGNKVLAVDFLRRAIQRHHDVMMEAGLDPTKADEALWAALEGRWEFDSFKPSDL